MSPVGQAKAQSQDTAIANTASYKTFREFSCRNEKRKKFSFSVKFIFQVKISFFVIKHFYVDAIFQAVIRIFIIDYKFSYKILKCLLTQRIFNYLTKFPCCDKVFPSKVKYFHHLWKFSQQRLFLLACQWAKISAVVNKFYKINKKNSEIKI